MKWLVMGLGMPLLLCAVCYAQTDKDIGLELLRATAPAVLHFDRPHHNLSFVHWPTAIELAGNSPQEKADFFINTYGAAFGAALGKNAFYSTKEQTDAAQRVH
ncbi:MAG: hypothetical protein AAGJ82_03995, partial [Bacteroidota bacterium]